MERKHNGIIMYMVVFSLNETLYYADCNIVCILNKMESFSDG